MKAEESKFLDKLFGLGKECGLDRREVYRVISKIAQHAEPQEDRWKTGKHPLLNCDKDVSEDLEKKWIDFHHHLVKEIITFINDNPEIDKIYKELRDLRQKSLLFTPSLDAHFSLSDLDESLKEGDWVPSLDSCLVLFCGGQTIMESM